MLGFTGLGDSSQGRLRGVSQTRAAEEGGLSKTTIRSQIGEIFQGAGGSRKVKL